MLGIARVPGITGTGAWAIEPTLLGSAGSRSGSGVVHIAAVGTILSAGTCTVSGRRWGGGVSCRGHAGSTRIGRHGCRLVRQVVILSTCGHRLVMDIDIVLVVT